MGDFASIGPFEISELIGTGGMSAVFKGEHRMDAAPAAVKVMTGKFTRRDRYRRAVYREIRATSKLNHPGIVKILDFGEVTEDLETESKGKLKEGSPWYAMERVDGDALSDATIAWNWWLFRDVLLDLLDALAHAHATDVVHRDLKPSNVLICSGKYGTSRIKLIDFGISRSFDVREGDSRGELADAEVYGTPKYMAPEQILGYWRDQGPWTDLYSVGCLAWRLACGHPPYDAEETKQVLRAHIHAHLPPFSPSLPLPDGFDEWLLRLLAKDPRERFRRAADAAFDLLRLGDPEDADVEARQHHIEGRSQTGTSRLTLGIFEETDSSEFTDTVEAPPSVPGLAPLDGGDDDPLEGSPVTVARHTWTPPFPDEWHRQGELEGDYALSGAGLDLLGLRTVPIVDRRSTRDRLWANLGVVCREGKTRGVLLKGPTGFGKTRLAQWVKRRSHEVGATEVLVATHSRMTGESDGLGPMLARHFRCSDMSVEEAFDRVKAIYESLRFSEAAARYDAMGLVSMMNLDSDTGRELLGFRTPRERNLAMCRLLKHLAAPRPVVLVLDDLQWGKESADFARFLFEEDDLPVLLVATVSREAVDEQPETESLLSNLEGHSGIESVHVGQLTEHAQKDLVSALLPFHPQLAEEAAERTRGDPLFAVQLVDDWAEEEILEPSPSGYSFRQGVESPFPDDIHQLWERRVERLIDFFAPEDRDAAKTSLQLAAALGQVFTREEWTNACRRVGVEVDGTILDEMLRRGLAVERGGHLMFEHDTLQRSLADSARRMSQWRRYQEVAAGVVDELYPKTDLDVLHRRAHHFLAADRPRHALDPLLEATRRALQGSRFTRAQRLFDKTQEVIDRLDLPRGDRFRIYLTWLNGWLERNFGKPRAARLLTDKAIQLARQEEMPWQLGHSLLIRGSVERDAGQYGNALTYYREGLTQFTKEGSEHDIAITTYLQGVALGGQCKWDQAIAKHEEALEIFESLDDLLWQARCLTAISTRLIATDRYDEARENSKNAMDAARRAGARVVEASCWNDLGEIARFQNDWETARECYRRAEELYALSGSRSRFTARINLALVDVETGNYAVARPVFDELLDIYPEIGFGKHIPILYIGQLCCAAGLEDWDAWAAAKQRYFDFTKDREFDAQEAGYLLNVAADIALEADAPEKAVDALDMAARLYRDLGFPDRATSIDERIEELG